MALIPPAVEELGLFRSEPYATEEATYVTSVLQQATDGVWAATGLDEYPSDPRAGRITRNAIMQFSLWLMSQDEHRDEINSPYSSERIGSYSYSKMQSAMKGEETGIFWLDMLFKYLGLWTGTEESSWSNSENVFEPEGLTYAEQQWLVRTETLPDYYGW